MKCPRTGKAMKEVEIGGVKIDVSEGCGGIWFDNFELKKFDEKIESAGEELIKLMEQYRNDTINTSEKIHCPRHPEITMMRHYFSPRQQFEIDECAQCGGVWLDPGELATLRGQFATEAERNKAGEAFVNSVFDSPEIKAMKTKSEEDLKKARRFANMFRYICPTAYIPGKQDWGAF